MTRRVVVVVVGASRAGASAATGLRDLGFDGRVDLVGAEPALPYERPALSKAYLAGDASLDDLLLHPADAYVASGIDVHLGVAAVGLDPHRRTVDLDDGSTLTYDALVVATGSVNRRPGLPGIDLPGVQQLRTLADADALRAQAAGAGSAVVVGQGFLGCEVAATLRGRGLAVTVVEPQPGPLHGPLGPEVSARVADWHRDHGVRLLNGVGVARLAGSGAVDAVHLDDGTVLPADLVVVAVGARPASGWLTGSGLRTGHGAVLVDEQGRTSAAGVHAAGDVSAWRDAATGSHRRVEHDDAAAVQGQCVARAIAGAAAAPPAPSWFWSDQYDHALQYTGEHRPGDGLRWRGATGFWLRDGTVTAVVSLDDGRTFRRAMALVGTHPDMGDLLDEGVDLRTLHRAARQEPAPA